MISKWLILTVAASSPSHTRSSSTSDWPTWSLHFNTRNVTTCQYQPPSSPLSTSSVPSAYTASTPFLQDAIHIFRYRRSIRRAPRSSHRSRLRLSHALPPRKTQPLHPPRFDACYALLGRRTCLGSSVCGQHFCLPQCHARIVSRRRALSDGRVPPAEDRCAA